MPRQAMEAQNRIGILAAHAELGPQIIWQLCAERVMRVVAKKNGDMGYLGESSMPVTVQPAQEQTLPGIGSLVGLAVLREKLYTWRHPKSDIRGSEAPSFELRAAGLDIIRGAG